MSNGAILGLTVTLKDAVTKVHGEDCYNKISKYMEDELGIDTSHIYNDEIIKGVYEVLTYVSDDYSVILDTHLGVEQLVRIVTELMSGNMENKFLIQQLIYASSGLNYSEGLQLVSNRYRVTWILLNEHRSPSKVAHVENFISAYQLIEYGHENIPMDVLVTNRKYVLQSEYNPYQVAVGENKKVKVYRGECSKSTPLSKNPYSWTLSKSVAKMFATRFDVKGLIHEGEVSIDDVLAYSTQEEEIIVSTKKVKVLSTSEVIRD